MDALDGNVFYSDKYTDERRAHALGLLDALGNIKEFNKLSKKHKQTIVKHLEEICYKDSRSGLLYQDICYHVRDSLKNRTDDNDEFINDIITCSIVKATENKYVQWRPVIRMYEGPKKSTKLRRCPKCKKNDCTTESIQNRSLDEGNNLLITCRFCSNTWTG